MRYLAMVFIAAILCATALGITLGIRAIRSPPAKEQQATKFEERLPRVMIAPKVATPQVATPQVAIPQVVTPQVAIPQVVSPPEPAPAAPAPALQKTPAAPIMTTPVSVAEGAQTKAPRFRPEYDGLCERYHLHREDYTRTDNPTGDA
jgi:hypothetical protein